MEGSESSTKRSRTQSSDYCDSPDYLTEPPVVTQLCDRDLDNNDRPVMQSRVSNCSFCHKQHTCKCWKRIGRCLSCGSSNHLVGECPKNPYRNPHCFSIHTIFEESRALYQN
ncbi:hypothetical protein V6N11_012456 [Hibiscus sabdariffa]|uniref:CCHC-type domain-containing protein n=1 Tax=Hibiscus sabdariffa TaxID=183260 RepID=A0ABR2QBM6_9ROSI